MAEARHPTPPALTETFPEVSLLSGNFKKDATPISKKPYFKVEGPVNLNNIVQADLDEISKGLSYQNIQEIIANLPEQISLSNLSDEACKFLARLCTFNSAVKLASKLSFDIDWSNNSAELNFLLTTLVENHLGQLVLESLPNPLSLENLKFGRLLVTLVKSGFKEELKARLANVINLNLVADFGGAFLFLRSLFKEVDKSEKKELFERFEINLNLNEISKSLGKFLAFLVEQGFGQDLVDKLLAKINLETLSEGGNLLLDALCRKGFEQEVLVKLPNQIDVEKLLGGNDSFLIFLAKNKLTSKSIFTKLPETIIPHQCSSAMGHILDYLVRNGFGEQLFNKLSPSIEINAIDDGMAYFLLSLARMSNRYLYLIGKKISSPIKIDSLSRASDYLLSILINNGLAADVADNLVSPISLASSDITKNYDSLNSLSELGYEDLLVQKLPDSIDANQLSVGASEFLKVLIQKGYGDIVESKILDSIPLESIEVGTSKENNQTKNLIRDLLQAGLGEKIKQKLQPQFQELEQLRTGIRVSSDELPQEPVGQSLEEMITSFPLNWQEKESKLGWSKFKLAKTGVSTAWIKFDPDDLESTRIVFSTAGIGEASLDTYRSAIKLMPTGVNRAFYPELAPEGSDLDYFYADGFREVFAGPALARLALEKFPKKVAQSIEAQYHFILWTLLFNGIEHGHAHKYNFNVRFLLQDQQGKKTLLFDANEALRRAAQENQTITPIVTLRDWDAGKSS